MLCHVHGTTGINNRDDRTRGGGVAPSRKRPHLFDTGQSPRVHVHFTPTSSSWLNLVERFFGGLTEEVIREGSFTSVRQLVNDIEAYLSERNLNPKPYRWKAEGEVMLAKIKRAKEVLTAQKAERR